MWEQIRANKRKSWLLIILMGILLVALGYTIGGAVATRFRPRGSVGVRSFSTGGIPGAGIALLVWAGLVTTALSAGDKVVLAMSGATRIDHDDHPRLFNVVEEMSIAAGMATPPAVYIINDRAANAFAVGRSPKRSAIAVTRGLLEKLDRDELQGVVAHETGHIINHDVVFVTTAAVMLGTIVLLCDMFLRFTFYSGRGGRYRSSSSRRSGGGGGQTAIYLGAILLAVLAPILARILYFAISRRREYLADAQAARLTRYPEGLASALDKIAGSFRLLETANRVTEPMYIVNPRLEGRRAGLFSTHPATAERVHILRSMGGGAGLAAYRSAWKKAGAQGACPLPTRAVEASTDIKARQPSGEKTSRADVRQATDILRRLDGFLFLSCTCGLRLKLPPGFSRDHVDCPRCGTTHTIPKAMIAAAAAGRALEKSEETAPGKQRVSDGASPPEGPASYTHVDGTWSSFRCICDDHTFQLSPSFTASAVRCPKCKRTVQVIHERAA